MRKLLAILALLVFPALAQAQSKMVIGYYPYWEVPEYPTSRIDYSAVNVLSLVQWPTQASGGIDTSHWNAGGTGGAQNCTPVVTAAHNAGSKVIMLLGGAGQDGNFDSNITTFQSTFLTNIANVVTACNLDGVDLDWEALNPGSNYTDYANFASAMRTAHPSWTITVFIDGTLQTSALALDMVNAGVDRVNAGTYGFGFTGSGWNSWYFAPIYGYFGAPQTYTSVDGIVGSGTNGWLAAGVPASKINIGAGFYGNGWSGVTAPLQNAASATVPVQEIPYGWPSGSSGGPGLLACYYTASGGTYFYDPSPALSSQSTHSPNFPYQPSIEFPSTITPSAPCPTNNVGWITYEDEASIAQKGSYINSKGFGGIILWTLNEGAVDPTTGRNPLLDAVKRYLNNGSPAPLTQLGFSRGEVCPTPLTLDCSGGSVVNITVSGLSNPGLVDVSWNNDTSGTAADQLSDPGFGSNGHPSRYTIQCSTNGSTFSTCSNCEPACNAFTSTTDNFMTHQFAVDLTGTSTVAVRMNITATDSAANENGFVGLSVQGASGTNDLNDTFMIFGDSLTSNCWGANFNGPAATGGVEVLGSLIHAARPAHYPINSYFGQSGWKTSDALSTSTYSPNTNFQQFMAQFPAVKYVGIELGTNDANGGVAPATFCNNLRTLAMEAIAAGKTPIIPTLINSPAFAGGAHDASNYNSCTATLLQNMPSILAGPDLYTLFSGHTQTDGWFFDNLHPAVNSGYVTGGNCNSTTVNATPCGCIALQNAWANTLETAVFPLAAVSNPVIINGKVTILGKAVVQ